MKFSMLAMCTTLALSNACFALEIKNPKISTTGNVITLNYDLFGKPGERSANVKVSVVIDGERYKPGTINLKGDYGSNITVGKNKKITWDLVHDMPAGYVGPINFEMDADPEASNDPFNMLGTKNKMKPPIVSENTVADPKSKLVWIRSPLAIKPVNSLEAAVAVIGKMNQQNYLGYNDWRLPKKDEYETLLKMVELYGYKSGQSVVPYFAKVGFDITSESKFWTIDKSSLEIVGRSVSVYGSGQYGGSASGTGSSNSSYKGSSGKYTRNMGGSVSASGSANYSGRATATAESVYDGMDTLFIDTKDGYFYKHNKVDNAYVFAVRGDSSAELYGMSVKADVSINP